MKTHLDECNGKASIGLRNGERYCNAIIPGWNDHKYECCHAVRERIADVGTGNNEMLKKVFMCESERK